MGFCFIYETMLTQTNKQTNNTNKQSDKKSDKTIVIIRDGDRVRARNIYIYI